MKPAAFQYVAPTSLALALAALSDYGDWARLIAGGQSLVPMMNMRLAQPAVLIDLNRLPELDGIERTGDGLVIGATVRHHDLATSSLVRDLCPVLAVAAASIGHYAIRQRGTIGGSLAHADPAAQLPLVAVLLDAEVEVASATGRRRVAARDFFQGIMTTALAADELITAVRLPPMPPSWGWGFHLFERRAGDFAIALAAAIADLDPAGRIAGLRVAVGGVEARPVLWTDVAGNWVGQTPGDGVAAALASHIVSRLQAEDDPRIPAVYRRELAAVMVKRAVVDAFTRAGRG
ncbi:FAD binding domain-containing protein [Ferrovibrio xuzhouensis]|uniref:FAD binding domain-containing protein n=1 Tax=Ferrovibrio xuzhouensis TaxID=1576914 RepID=A0ABV7VP90_9PROT